jgi:predicted nucleic acid-binding protein
VILVDTSSWIHMLRRDGDPATRARVEKALQSGEACWCPIIRLELWNGAGGSREKKVIRDFEKLLPELAITEAVWAGACDLARRARAAAVTIPATDLLIAACARHYSVELETVDSDFAMLSNLTTG